MDSMRSKKGACPLGHTCVSLKEDNEGPYKEVCPWFEEFAYRDANGEIERVEGECGIRWSARFLAQQSDQLVGLQQATEGGRNAMVGLVEIARGQPPVLDTDSVKKLEN